MKPPFSFPLVITPYFIHFIRLYSCIHSAFILTLITFSTLPNNLDLIAFFNYLTFIYLLSLQTVLKYSRSSDMRRYPRRLSLT